MRSTAPKRALIACSTFDYPYHSPQSRLFGDTLTHNLIARAADAGIEAELVDTLQGGVSPEAALKGFDLLVVLGGADVHPNLYGHERSRYTRTSPMKREICSKFPCFDTRLVQGRMSLQFVEACSC